MLHARLCLLRTAEAAERFPLEVEHILSSPEGDLEPLYSVEPTQVPSEYGYLPGYTYTVVDDAKRGRVLFAGLDGMIRSLELASGEVAELLSPPGTP